MRPRIPFRRFDGDYILEEQAAISAAFISAREMYGISREDMAEKAGYSTGKYTGIENGDQPIRWEDYVRIARVFADTYDGRYPPFKRFFRSPRSILSRWIYAAETNLEKNIPALKRIFDELPLQDIMIYLQIYGLIILLTHVYAYEIGGGLAVIYKWIDKILNG